MASITVKQALESGLDKKLITHPMEKGELSRALRAEGVTWSEHTTLGFGRLSAEAGNIKVLVRKTARARSGILIFAPLSATEEQIQECVKAHGYIPPGQGGFTHSRLYKNGS